MNYDNLHYHKMKPVAFHPYTSATQARIYDCDKDEMDGYEKTRNDLISMFTKAGIKAYVDNKTVFEMEFNGVPIFFGFYDSHFSIGLAVRHWR